MKIRKIFNEGLDKFPSNINDINFGIIDSNDPEKDKFVAVTNAIDDWESENNKKDLTKNFRSTLATIILENGIDENNDFIKFVKEADDEVLKGLTAFGANSIVKFFNSENFKDDFWKELIVNNDLVKGSAQDITFKLNVVNEIINSPNEWKDASGNPIKLDQLKPNGKYLKAADIKNITDKYSGEDKSTSKGQEIKDGIPFKDWLKNTGNAANYTGNLQKSIDAFSKANGNNVEIQKIISDIIATLKDPKIHKQAYDELMSILVGKNENNIDNVVKNIIEIAGENKKIGKAVRNFLLRNFLIIKGKTRDRKGLISYINELIIPIIKDKTQQQNFINKLNNYLNADVKNIQKILNLQIVNFTSKDIYTAINNLIQ